MSKRAAPRRTSTLMAVGAATSLAVTCVPAALATTTDTDSSGTPKNVILLISDGGGYNQYDIASIYESGQASHQVVVDPKTGAITNVPGDPVQIYETWPVQLSQSHYSASGRGYYDTNEAWGSFDWVKEGPTDSAAAGTALGTGVKTNNGILGITPDGDRLLTLGEQAQAVGKAVGLVTSVPFAHATPSGFIAHNPDRWDNHGIANEIIDSGVDVVIGGGHPNYTDANKPRSSHYGEGSWISQADFERVSSGQTPFTYIESKSQFEQVAAGENVPDKLFGLARVAETLQYNRPGLETNNNVLPFTDPFNTDVPSLETAAKAALNVLEQDEDGFFLMIEGGAVDWAGHANQTTRVIEEQIGFNDSIEAVSNWVETNSSWDETLVIITADHETGFLSGPGAGSETGWTPLEGEAGELPNVTWHSGNHTNSLVPLFAKGTGSDILAARAVNWDIVRGAYLDNTDIGEVIFDFLGHSESGDLNAVGINAAVVRDAAPAGSLRLSVEASTPVVLAGEGSTLAGELPEATVLDSRNDVQAQGNGWTLSGTARDFVAGNRSFGAAALAWAPRIIASESGASSGAITTLEAPAVLASADLESRVGSTVVGADLTLTVPADAKAGNYGSEITLSLFAQD